MLFRSREYFPELFEEITQFPCDNFLEGIIAPPVGGKEYLPADGKIRLARVIDEMWDCGLWTYSEITEWLKSIGH